MKEMELTLRVENRLENATKKKKIVYGINLKSQKRPMVLQGARINAICYRPFVTVTDAIDTLTRS